MSSTEQEGLLWGRDALQAHWRGQLLALPSGFGGNTLTLCDARFEAWPLGEPEVLQALASWLRLPGRQLRLVALDYDAVSRQHARFTRWRRDWSHRIDAWSPVEPALGLPPVHWLAEQQAVAWLDATRWRARAMSAANEVQQARHQIDALLQRCEPAWPVHQAGL